MFRDLRRFKQEATKDECEEVLIAERRAAFSVNGEDGYPYTLPINFYYDKEENKIYFHSAIAGHKIDALLKDNRICFTTWTQGEILEGEWFYRPMSVIIFGKATRITDKNIIKEKLMKLALKYFPDSHMPHAREELADDNIYNRVALYSIDIEHMTGKHVKEK